MIVKICGIKTTREAELAIEAGADMLGYNFFSNSVRYVDPAACADIQESIRGIRTRVVSVGVFVNHPVEEIKSIMASCRLDLAQLSGDETAADLAELGQRAFKAIRPRSLEDARAHINGLENRASAPEFLLDTYHPGLYGGTGEQGDWGLAAELAAGHALLLAGGLNSANVGEAVQQVKPGGVDVASGVEARPGVKDPKRIRAFIENARTSTQ